MPHTDVDRQVEKDLDISHVSAFTQQYSDCCRSNKTASSELFGRRVTFARPAENFLLHLALRTRMCVCVNVHIRVCVHVYIFQTEELPDISSTVRFARCEATDQLFILIK
jgi:hypothetical protein